MKINIEPFTIVVTPEQSKIVQEILFANGYCWGSGEKIIKNYFDEYLIFEYFSTNTEPRLRITDAFDFDESKITFEEFTNKYDIKRLRKEKLKRIANEKT